MDQLLRMQGINPEDDSVSREQASQIIMKVIMDYNCSGIRLPIRQRKMWAQIKKDLNSYSDYMEGSYSSCETKTLILRPYKAFLRDRSQAKD